MKWALRIVVGLAVVVIVIVVGTFLFIDAIAKRGVERGATYALGVQTTLGSADVGIMRGDFSMKRLHVDNPEGFDADHFLTMDRGYVSVSLGTLREQTVELPSLQLSDLDVILEKKDGEANYKVITDNLKRFESKDEAPEETPGPGKSFVVREVVISNVNVQADVTGVGGKLNRVRVPIKEIRLQNVGTGEGHELGMGDLTDVIVKAIFAAIIANSADFPKDLVNDLGPALDQLASLADLGIKESFSAVGDVTGAAGKIGEDLGKSAEDVGKGLEDAAKGIGDIFGGKKDE